MTARSDHPVTDRSICQLLYEASSWLGEDMLTMAKKYYLRMPTCHYTTANSATVFCVIGDNVSEIIGISDTKGRRGKKYVPALLAENVSKAFMYSVGEIGIFLTTNQRIHSVRRIHSTW